MALVRKAQAEVQEGERRRGARPSVPFHLRLALWLVPTTAAFASAQPAVAVETGAAARIAARVEAVGMTVADVDRSVGFYSTVLGFAKVSDVEVAGSGYERLLGVFGARARVVRMRLGGELLELTEFLTPRGRPVPADFRGNDRWFQHVAIVVSDMGRAYRRLRDHRVAHVSTGPQRLPDRNRNAAGIEAFYFADPDGHRLELLAFPPDKGDPKWRRPGDRLFLGIDHTAIVVGDAEASLRFYRDLPGFEVAGESGNYEALGFGVGLLVNDPDGHTLELIER